MLYLLYDIHPQKQTDDRDFVKRENERELPIDVDYVWKNETIEKGNRRHSSLFLVREKSFL